MAFYSTEPHLGHKTYACTALFDELEQENKKMGKAGKDFS